MKKGKTPAGLLAVLGAAILAMALMAPIASAATPKPGYSQFAGCQDNVENPKVTGCLNMKIKSGNFKMGSKNVPIEKPFRLSGGYAETGAFSFNSKGGMEKVKQKVPGGVIGLTGLTWLAEFLGIEALTLYATTELAGARSLSRNPPTCRSKCIWRTRPVFSAQTATSVRPRARSRSC